ncbi:unnamed protein product, partial [Prorocentrum cordatum]
AQAGAAAATSPGAPPPTWAAPDPRAAATAATAALAPAAPAGPPTAPAAAAPPANQGARDALRGWRQPPQQREQDMSDKGRDPVPSWSGENPMANLRPWLRSLAISKRDAMVPGREHGARLFKSLAIGSEMKVAAGQALASAFMSEQGWGAVIAQSKLAYVAYLEIDLEVSVKDAILQGDREKGPVMAQHLARGQPRPDTILAFALPQQKNSKRLGVFPMSDSGGGSSSDVADPAGDGAIAYYEGGAEEEGQMEIGDDGEWLVNESGETPIPFDPMAECAGEESIYLAAWAKSRRANRMALAASETGRGLFSPSEGRDKGKGKGERKGARAPSKGRVGDEIARGGFFAAAPAAVPLFQLAMATPAERATFGASAFAALSSPWAGLLATEGFALMGRRAQGGCCGRIARKGREGQLRGLWLMPKETLAPPVASRGWVGGWAKLIVAVDMPIGVGGVGGIVAARAVADSAGQEVRLLFPVSLVNGLRGACDFDRGALLSREFEVEAKIWPMSTSRWGISVKEPHRGKWAGSDEPEQRTTKALVEQPKTWNLVHGAELLSSGRSRCDNWAEFDRAWAKARAKLGRALYAASESCLGPDVERLQRVRKTEVTCCDVIQNAIFYEWPPGVSRLLAELR